MAMMRMRMQMRRTKHRKQIMDQRRMWRTEGIVGFNCEHVMSTGKRAKMGAMQIRMRRKKHRKLMMDQRRM